MDKGENRCCHFVASVPVVFEYRNGSLRSVPKFVFGSLGFSIQRLPRINLFRIM